jgi:hypothetical protein
VGAFTSRNPMGFHGLEQGYLYFLLLLYLIVIIRNTTIFEPQPSLQNSAKFDPVFSSLEFATLILLQSRVVSVATNPKPGGPVLYIYVLQ